MSRPENNPPSTNDRQPTPRTVPFTVAPTRIDFDATKVIKRLVRSGHAAYLVGGCVRDLLLGRTPKDFDVVTSARPNEVRHLFRNCRVIGRRFRLAHILFGGQKIIEVATFRKDPSAVQDTPESPEDWDPPTADDLVEDHEMSMALGSAGLRRARPDDEQDLLIRHDNVFGEPWEDAVRRDFTMNALFYDIERRELVDFVGGLDDVERRLIRTIGDADVRFREDPVRILRAIKFAARLDFAIEPNVYDAMVAHREDLLRAARPRLLEEVLRLLRGGASRRSFWLAWETGVLSVILPELSSFLDDDDHDRTRLWRRLAALDALVARNELPSDAALLVTLLLEPIEEFLRGSKDSVHATQRLLEELAERLAMPRRMFDRVRQIVAVQRRIHQGRHLPLVRKDFFPDSAAVWSLDATARGLDEGEIRRTLEGREAPARPQPKPRPQRETADA
jgi:poly(A) polymerase